MSTARPGTILVPHDTLSPVDEQALAAAES